MAKAKTSDSKAVAPTKGTAVAKSGKMNFRADAGKGMEGATELGSDAFAIPFFSILQKGSKEVDKDSGKGGWIKGAVAGEIFNTVTKERIAGDEGMQIICCAFKRVFLRWGANRGGFKGEVAPDALAAMRNAGTVKDIDGRMYVALPDGTVNEKKCDLIQDHRNHFVLGFNGKRWSQGLISVKSTQIKKSKALNSALADVVMEDEDGKPFNPPTFANVVRFKTVPESNDDGSWHGYDFTIEGEVTDPDAYAAAARLYESFTKGAVNVNYAAMDGDDAGGAKPAGGKF